MRIGIFTETYTPYISGLVTSEVMLKHALEKLGHEVYVVTANLENFKYSYDEKERVLKIPGIPTGIYDSRLTGIYPIKAIKKIKSWNLDVIHSQTEFAIGTFARIFGKQYGIPVVHTYHTMYEDYVHYITKGYFTKPGIKLVEYLTKFYCDKTVSELIVPTKKTYDLFKNKYGIEREVNIIPTGIDIERFKNSNFDSKEINDLKNELGIKKDDFVLLLVSRISEEQKNIKILIDSQKIINKKYKNIKFLIVGDGPDLEYFKKMTKNNKNIIYTGMVPWNVVAKYYQLGNVFVTASKTETQGLTVIEAMAASLPVVCLDDDSFKIAIIDNYNGLFFKNKKEYINSIFKIYEKKDEYAIMRKHAVLSSKQFSSKYYGERILEVYDKAILEYKKSIVDKIKNIIRGKMNG